MRRGELLLGPGDVLIGDVGPASFYIDREMDERWGHPASSSMCRPGRGRHVLARGREDLHFTLIG